MKRKTVNRVWYYGYLIGALRRIWRWSKSRREIKSLDVCNMCNKRVVEKEKVVDHVDPVIDPKVGFQTWDIVIDRMFNGKLQLLHKSCHKIKTAAENKLRRKAA